MKKSVAFLVALLVCLLLFTACGEQHTTPTTTTTSPQTLTVPVGDLVGKTVGDAQKVFGTDFEWLGYKGSSSMYYARYGMDLVLAGGWYDNPTDDNVLKYATSGSAENPILGNITRHMTYPDLVSAIGSEVTLPEPTFAYSAMNDRQEYTLEFTYQNLRVKALWLEDPQTTLFNFVEVWDPTLPIVKD